MKHTVFISGHLDLTYAEFAEHYLPKIQEYINLGYNFVVGDARGCDFYSQRILSLLSNFINPHCYVTVYHMFDAPRNLVSNLSTVGGFKSDDERDAAMTEASTMDLAWVRPGREKSGTAKNLLRRKKNI